jgi:hypothetical protein
MNFATALVPPPDPIQYRGTKEFFYNKYVSHIFFISFELLGTLFPSEFAFSGMGLLFSVELESETVAIEGSFYMNLLFPSRTPYFCYRLQQLN